MSSTTLRSTLAAAFLLAGSLFSPLQVAAADVRVAVQFGLPYLPLMVMEADKLLEAEAVKRGLPDTALKLMKLSGTAAVNDAILSGAVDLGIVGTPGLLIAWDKTKSSLAVKGLASCATHPLVLNTNKAHIKTLADLGPADRIALPAINSGQAIVLGMAAEKLFGPGQAKRFTTSLVALPNPDAMAALLTGTEISAHFTVAPFSVWEAADPKIHRLITSTEVMGEAASITILVATAKWIDANPKLAEAVFAAMQAAMQRINSDRRHAAEVYLKNEPSKMTIEFVEKLLADPENTYTVQPTGIMAYADFMHRTGQLKDKPSAWEDTFFQYVRAQK